MPYTVNMTYGFYVVYIAITSGKIYILCARAPDKRPHRVSASRHPEGIKYSYVAFTTLRVRDVKHALVQRTIEMIITTYFTGTFPVCAYGLFQS